MGSGLTGPFPWEPEAWSECPARCRAWSKVLARWNLCEAEEGSSFGGLLGTFKSTLWWRAQQVIAAHIWTS